MWPVAHARREHGLHLLPELLQHHLTPARLARPSLLTNWKVKGTQNMESGTCVTQKKIDMSILSPHKAIPIEQLQDDMMEHDDNM